MKKLFKMFLLVFLFLLCFKINAECRDTQLKKDMDNFEIKIVTDSDYLDKINAVMDDNKQFNYILTFTPYIENIDIVVNNDDKKTYVDYSNDYNQYYVGSYFSDTDTIFNIKVFGSEYSSCPGELVFSKDFRVPKFNNFSLSEYCDYNPKEEICNPCYDIDQIQKEELVKIATENIDNNTKNMTITQKAIEFIKNNWYFIFIPVLIISIIYVIAINKYKENVSNL